MILLTKRWRNLHNLNQNPNQFDVLLLPNLYGDIVFGFKHSGNCAVCLRLVAKRGRNQKKLFCVFTGSILFNTYSILFCFPTIDNILPFFIAL